MSDVVNWGILGAANFAREQMGRAIHAAEGARLSALATSSAAKADGFKAFCPDLRVHSSYDDLLADPDIDAVYIPLPNHMHVEWATKALNAGKHVLCEKPVALKADEIDGLIALRDQTGLLAAEAYMIVHHPQWQRVKELVKAGAIGTLMQVNGQFSYYNDDKANIRNQADTGGGGIRDIGVYTYGSARYVTGEEPIDVRSQVTFENGVDTIAHCQAEFPSFSYSATVSTRMYARQEMVFHGTEGMIRVNVPFNAGVHGMAEIEIHQPNMGVRHELFPDVNHYVEQVQNFCASVRDGREYPCSLEFSQGTQRMLDMVFAAANKG
ncbi:MAG: Gfo/Idh/MocA family oxidoreductase [Pseudoruegeria sp.]